MKCLVTGAAGFIGSHLCEALLARGDAVTGVDAFIPYYPRKIKERNLRELLNHPAFAFHELDLRNAHLEKILEGQDVVFHLAAMPGLVKSWQDFDGYWSCNVLTTQRLLAAASLNAANLQRFILVSTSSVYGGDASGPETLPTLPISPYGVTKLAGEHTARAYGEAFGIPIVILRYFSVYGPRQRPDMGYFKFIRALLTNEPVTVFGDGKQARGNTFVTDCVTATMQAVTAPPGSVFNVGGGEAANVWDILRKLEGISGKRFTILREPARPGDQKQTLADTSAIRTSLHWMPQTSLDDGLAAQFEWQRTILH